MEHVQFHSSHRLCDCHYHSHFLAIAFVAAATVYRYYCSLGFCTNSIYLYRCL